MNTELRRRLPKKPEVHEKTLGKHLDGVLYSLKLTRVLPADRGRPDVIEGRHDYANWILEKANEHRPVFIDECGFNICMDSQNSRTSSRWRTCLSSSMWAKGKIKLTICLAVSHVFGLVYYTVQGAAMTRESFNEFIETTGNNLDENENQYFIFDGAPAYRRAEQPRENVHLENLPPYSPFLNIAGQAISCLRLHYTRFIGTARLK